MTACPTCGTEHVGMCRRRFCDDKCRTKWTRMQWAMGKIRRPPSKRLKGPHEKHPV